MKILGIIPSRYASTRFPGKPLAKIGSKTMIERVYIQAKKAFDDVVVATDDNRIFDHVKSFGGNVVMTSDKHESGTDRCFEALCKYQEEFNKTFDIVVNIQGDEPYVLPEQLLSLSKAFEDKDTQIATLVKEMQDNDSIFNENHVKVVISKKNFAIYFSRLPIPFQRGVDKNDWIKSSTYYHHIGVYAYRSEVLAQITKLEKSMLERTEKLEQNRWLENDYKIKAVKTDFVGFGVDTPEDLQKLISVMNPD